jgi:hypothetical protein
LFHSSSVSRAIARARPLPSRTMKQASVSSLGRREAARRGHWRDISSRANVSDIDLSSCRYVTAASLHAAPGGVFPARMAVEAPCPARRRSIITNRCSSDLLDLSLRSALDQPDLANGETGVKMERFNGIDPTGIARARRALGVQKKRP